MPFFFVQNMPFPRQVILAWSWVQHILCHPSTALDPMMQPQQRPQQLHKQSPAANTKLGRCAWGVLPTKILKVGSDFSRCAPNGISRVGFEKVPLPDSTPQDALIDCLLIIQLTTKAVILCYPAKHKATNPWPICFYPRRFPGIRLGGGSFPRRLAGRLAGDAGWHGEGGSCRRRVEWLGWLVKSKVSVVSCGPFHGPCEVNEEKCVVLLKKPMVKHLPWQAGQEKAQKKQVIPLMQWVANKVWVENVWKKLARTQI